jgi:hypothetical protein
MIDTIDDIPTPDEIFKEENLIDLNLVHWFINEITNAIKTIKTRNGSAYFQIPRTPVNQATKEKVEEIFRDKGWKVTWFIPDKNGGTWPNVRAINLSDYFRSRRSINE